MRLVVCHGEGENFSLLDPDGIRRPYRVATMDPLWWEAAAELGLPRHFFKSRNSLLRFVVGRELLVVTVRDGTEDSLAIDAACVALGATPFRIYPT